MKDHILSSPFFQTTLLRYFLSFLFLNQSGHSAPMMVPMVVVGLFRLLLVEV